MAFVHFNIIPKTFIFDISVYAYWLGGGSIGYGYIQ